MSSRPYRVPLPRSSIRILSRRVEPAESDEEKETELPPPPGIPEEKKEEKQVIAEEFKCPICMNLYLKPTLFECGHTFCLTCHYKLDKNEDSPTFSLPSFRGPLCRHSTITPWSDRAPNIALDKACKHMYPKEYQALVELESKCEEISKKIVEEGGKCDEEKEKERLENMSKLNLSQLSAESQRSLSERVYRKLMPMFFKVASKGKSHITITDPSLVSDIEICIQPLKKKLFENNNVYKITCTPEECSVYFSKCSMRWGREYHNEDHVHYPADGSEPQPVGSSTPSTPPIPSRRRASRNTVVRRDLRGESAIDRIIMNDLRSLVRSHISGTDM